MLLIALTIWLVLLVAVVLLCRMAAAADRRGEVFSAESYPSLGVTAVSSAASAPSLGAPSLGGVPSIGAPSVGAPGVRARGGRARAGRSVAGS
jgi:hypothetical protein